MSTPTATPLFWVHAAETDGANPCDNEELLPHYLCDFRASSVLTAVIFVASYIFKSPLFTSCLCATATHLITRLVKKLFADFSFMTYLEELGLTILRKAPYIYVIAALITLLFVWLVPFLSWLAAACIGILSGLTIEVHSDREHNRQMEEAGRV